MNNLAVSGGYKLFVKNLRVLARVGIHPYEKARPQPLVINLEAECAGETAEAKGIDDVVCYETIVAEFRRIIKDEEPFLLLENLATALARAAMADRRVKKMTLRLAKPTILSGVDSVGIEVSKSRE